MVVSFEKFHLEPASRCHFDSVSVYNGESIAASQLIDRYCGYSLPPDVLSAGSTVTVNFVTDGSHTGEGFLAYYTSVYGIYAHFPPA